MLKGAVVVLCLFACLFVIRAAHSKNTLAEFGWLAVLLMAGLASLAERQEEQSNEQRLSYAERQMIAIDFMCGSGQNWKGMSAFCGAQILNRKERRQINE